MDLWSFLRMCLLVLTCCFRLCIGQLDKRCAAQQQHSEDALMHHYCMPMFRFIVDMVVRFQMKHLILVTGEPGEYPWRCIMRGCLSRELSARLIYLTILRRIQDIPKVITDLSRFASRGNFICFGNPNEALQVLTNQDRPHYQLPLKGSDEEVIALGNTMRWFLVVQEGMNLNQTLLNNIPAYVDSNLYSATSVGWFEGIQLDDMYRVCDMCNISFSPRGFWNQSAGWDLSQIQNKLIRRKDLQGAMVKAVGIQVAPFYGEYANTSNGYNISGGMFSSLFELIAYELNFRYNITILEGYAYGNMVNGSWTGMIGMLNRGEADITSSEVSVTTDRLDAIDFSQSIIFTSRRMYMRTQGLFETKWWFYVNPLSPVVYLMTLLLFVSIGATIWLVERRRRKPNDKEPPLTVADSYISVIAAFCQTGSATLPESLLGRGLFWLGAVAFLIIFNCYSATLTSHLAVALKPAWPFRDLEGLVHKSKEWKAGPIRGDLANLAMESLCRGETDPASECYWLMELWDRIVSRSPDNLVSSYSEGVQKALGDNYVFMGVKDGVRYYLQQLPTDLSCSIIELPGNYLPGGLAFAIKKNWPYRNMLNFAILRLRESGLVHEMRKRFLPQLKRCTRDKAISASFGEVLFLYIFLCTGLVLSTFFLIVEQIWAMYGHRRRKADMPQIIKNDFNVFLGTGTGTRRRIAPSRSPVSI